jgi:CubicO group peptidase (beta-lactamase class C family)
MKSKALIAFFVIASATSPVQAQAPVTPAEGRLRAWLKVFNEADRAAAGAFLESALATGGAQPNQEFQPVAEAGWVYHFAARHSSKCVSMPRAGSPEAASLEQRACDGSDAQSFRLASTAGGGGEITTNGSYTIASKSTGQCVEAAATPPDNGTAIRPAACNGTSAQVWRLMPTYGGYYRVQAEGDPMRGWDVAGGPSAVADGTKVHLWRNVTDAGNLLEFRAMTGGFELRKIEETTATRVSGLLEEREGGQFARVTLEVEPAEPYRIVNMDLRRVRRPPEFALPRMAEAELVAALREKLEKDAAADKFSGAVMVARNGATVFSGAYGLADRDKKIPNTLDTRFRIGSMNKMFTATAVLQLAQAGKIKLNDPVGKYLTDYPNKDVATKVTIHHLLTHTGGTGDIFGPEFDAHRRELRTLSDYVKLYGERGPAFEPGSRWAYSNYGMLLLGVVIERVSGQSYYDYVRTHVYEPAGMTHSGSLAEDEVVPGRSVGYMRRDGAWRPNTDTLPYRGTSAGGGYSTVGDLVRFATALLGHKLLDAEYTELLTTGKVETPDGKYAYGFDESIVDGVRSFGHGGGAPGMNGDLRIYPQSGYVVAVLSNLDPPAAGRVSQFIGDRLPIGSKASAAGATQ